MITELFVALSGIDVAAVMGAIPPPCRTAPCSFSVVNIDESEALIELPPCRPRVAVRHLLPSLSVLTDRPYSARFELSTRSDRTWSSWVATTTLGSAAFGALPAAAGGLTCDVDVYTTTAPVEEMTLCVRVAAADLRAVLDAPWMATLSVSDVGPLASPDAAREPLRLTVPARSQMQAPSEIAARICSPTSVAMVLEYWSRPEDTASLAAEMFNAATDCYGVWPSAIQAAGRRGVAGYLLRFPDWSAATWCLARGLPIIASVRYAAGELGGAAITETSGHLVVITGHEGDDVLVNDPAAPTAASVRRRYRIEELRRAWLERSGVGYVLFRPDEIRGA